MGARFELEHTNIIAYLTAPGRSIVPRLREAELHDFLEAMSVYDQSGQTKSSFISHERQWPQNMARIARESGRNLGRGHHYIGESEVVQALSRLCKEFRRFRLFALVVGNGHRDSEMAALAEHYAYHSRGESLVLIPRSMASTARITVLDPLPAFALALEQRRNWPGVLFWSNSGAAAFVPADEVSDVFEKLLRAEREDRRSPFDLTGSTGSTSLTMGLSSRGSDSVDDLLRSFRARDHGIRLLHLSDLHYGRQEAAENEALLLAHLDQQLDSVQRVVITGDLFDNPSRRDAVLFRNFRATLVRRTGKDPVVIPGNHDQKWLGNLPADLRQVADLEWSSVVSDDELHCVFLCFDSSKDADLARGRVTIEQMRDVAINFDTTAIRNPRLREYIPIGLVHHHPFSFETEKETLVQRILKKFRLSDERFMHMIDADEFITWVAKRGIPLILHGHKHVQRHFNKTVTVPGNRGFPSHRYVSAVGCGTSLGADGYPLSYNILIWDWHSRTWSASFFADPGDGSGFSRQCITTQVIPPTEQPSPRTTHASQPSPPATPATSEPRKRDQDAAAKEQSEQRTLLDKTEARPPTTTVEKSQSLKGWRGCPHCGAMGNQRHISGVPPNRFYKCQSCGVEHK